MDCKFFIENKLKGIEHLTNLITDFWKNLQNTKLFRGDWEKFQEFKTLKTKKEWKKSLIIRGAQGVY